MKKSAERPVINARKINKMRCIVGIVICSVVVVLTAVSFSLNITDYYSETSPEAGFGTLRMFTTLSNLMAAIAAFVCLPFQIDGLRRDKYKLPSWIVTVLFIGAVGTFLTFVVALSLISATQGIEYAMVHNSNLFMHTINPIFIALLFTLVISDSHIGFRKSLLSMIPITIYAFIYFIMVFVVKQWEDVYKTNVFIPWPVSLLLVLSLAFGLSQLLRFLHNRTHRYIEKSIARYYKESKDYEFPRVTEAIAHLAQVEAAFYYEGDDIYIPTDIIALLSERYSASVLPIDIEYDIYLENYLAAIKATKK